MFGEGFSVEYFGGRDGDAVAIDEGVEPVGGGTADGSEELVEAAMDG